MAKIDLGRVVGENGGFGNVRSTYISDGGMPSVGIEASGPDTAKDFDFIFSNIVNDPMTDEEIDGIVDGQYSQSSDVLNGRGLSRLWNWICELFAPKEHKHSASDLDSGTIDAARIANGTITKDMLDKTLGDSLSLSAYYAPGGGHSADLDGHRQGFTTYDTTTKHTPASNTYGMCACFNYAGAWLWQLAISTESDTLHVRRSINGNAWTAWKAIG